MAVQASSKTGFEKWQDGLSAAAGDEKWNGWDCEVQMAVNEYNRHLARKPGYMPLDWQLIKAMLWVETGANNSEWKSKPMQIGVAGDPGLASLFSGKEGGDLIVPPALNGRLTMETARTIPAYNIRAGIGYLLMRVANFEYRTVLGEDPRIYEATVKAGDSLDKIAKTHGSTVDVLKKLNPTVNVLRSGQILKYQKASTQRVITSWRNVTTILVAQRYNGGGDPNYAKKLDYALALVRTGKAGLCA